MTSEGLRPRVRGVLDPSKCHDPKRGVALHRAQEVPGKVFEALLSTGSLHVLFRVASAENERQRRDGLATTRTVCITPEDIESVVCRGWLECRGGFLSLTEAGREVTRALLVVARGFSKDGEEGARV